MRTEAVLQEGTRVVFRPGEDITAAGTPELRDALKAAVANGAREIEVNLSGVNIVDSSGIGLFVALHNSVSRLGGSLLLSNTSKDLMDLFMALRLDKHITISSTDIVEE